MVSVRKDPLLGNYHFVMWSFPQPVKTKNRAQLTLTSGIHMTHVQVSNYNITVGPDQVIEQFSFLQTDVPGEVLGLCVKQQVFSGNNIISVIILFPPIFKCFTS